MMHQHNVTGPDGTNQPVQARLTLIVTKFEIRSTDGPVDFGQTVVVGSFYYAGMKASAGRAKIAHWQTTDIF